MSRRLMLKNASGGGILPPEYQQVEWIRNTTKEGRVTFAVPNFTKIDFDIVVDAFTQSSYKDSGGNYIVYGNTPQKLSIGTSSVYGRIYIYSSSSTGVYDFDYYSKTVNIKAGLDTNAVNKRYFSITDGETTANSTQNLTGNIDISNINTIYLFSYPQYNDTQFYCRFRKMSIITDTASYNLIPCYRKNDSAIGLYDTVNGAFYNASGTFEKGADV